jgi:hypothetical protein
MGKNTPDRQDFIIDNLIIEADVLNEEQLEDILEELEV